MNGIRIPDNRGGFYRQSSKVGTIQSTTLTNDNMWPIVCTGLSVNEFQ